MAWARCIARDTQLGRDVALKILPAEFASDPDRVARFEQEARAVAALSHPNILAIYDFGKDQGFSFAVTELLQGETLRQRLENSALNCRKALEVAAAVADGLAAAHDRGIVHRDLKPENLFLTKDGHAKILDFGLAHVAAKAPGVDEPTATYKQAKTGPGTVVGTVGYMSPEQVRGQPVDARSDLFSLGCVLYEMVLGQRAFRHETAADTMTAILRDDPPQLQESGRVPPALQRVIRRCLEKKLEERFQSARDLAFDLRALADDSRSVADSATAKRSRWGGPAWAAVAALCIVAAAVAFVLLHRQGRQQPAGGAAGEIESVAVLPFVNKKGDPETEYLSDGLTESIINNLAQLPRLRVIARASVFHFKGRDQDAQAIGQQLKVQAVLTGSVSQHDNDLVVHAELVDVSDNRHLWADRYQRPLAEALLVQEEISRQIVDRLSARLTGDEQQRATKRYTENGSAYQQYLQGRYFWNKRTEAGLRKAIVYFQQALREDPHYALAHAGLADTYVVMADSVMLPPGEAWLKVEQEARAALEIDPTIAEAHTALANMTYIYRWNWPAAEEEFRRAIELKPSYATAHQWYFAFLTFSGRPEEALIQIDKAQELDPLSLIISANVGLRHYFARRYEQALAQFRKTLEMDPGFAPAKLQMAKTYACLGQYQRAIEESSKLVAAGPEKLTYKALLGQVYAAAGDRARAESILKELGALSKPRFVSAYLIAAIYAGLGQKGAALDSLEKARREHDAILPYLTVDPYFDSLRQEPRFVELLREIGPRR